MIFELLSFCRSMTENGSSARHQVGTCIEHCFVNHKVLLFPSEGSSNFCNVFVEVITYFYCILAERFERFKQRSFIIQEFSGIRNENGWNAECFSFTDVHNESG